jgi:hypothetical protein
VFALRCTAKLLKRVHAPLPTPTPVPTTRLGDWYATLLFTRPQLVLAVSARTLLSVLVPARDIGTLPARLRAAVADMLMAIGVSQPAVLAELHAMEEVAYARTASRQILGSLNDFAWMCGAYLGDRSLPDVALHLADAPCSPVRMDSPRRVTAALFAGTSRFEM